LHGEDNNILNFQSKLVSLSLSIRFCQSEPVEDPNQQNENVFQPNLIAPKQYKK